MKYWLFDFNVTEEWNKMWQDLWKSNDLKLIGLARDKKHPIINLIKGAWMALHESKKDDIIFCWFDFQAVMCFLLSKLTFRSRRIVALNVMCKFNNSLKGKLYAWLYKWALSSDNFYATVTSKEYGSYLNNMLGIHREYELIHDANESKYSIKNKENIVMIQNSVFMGGWSSRDWDFAFDLAKLMPDVTFNFVMPASKYKKYEDKILTNINIRVSIPLDEYNALAQASSIVMMISTTEAPAGLMLLFLAAANCKFYMTNYTATSCEYITDDRGCILPKRLDLWVEKIRYFLRNSKEANEKAQKLHDYIESECSLQKYVEGMKRLCSKIEQV